MFNNEGQLPPGLFIELCAPAWAKVHNEVSFGRASSSDRLPWSSDKVRKIFYSLTGFDPAKMQYGDIDAQHAALDAARELETAIYEADEIEELDGSPALDYAAGWMAAKTWLKGGDPTNEPPEDVVDMMMNRCSQANAPGNRSSYEKGFRRRLELGHRFVA